MLIAFYWFISHTCTTYGCACCKPGSSGDVSNTQQNFPVWGDSVFLPGLACAKGRAGTCQLQQSVHGYSWGRCLGSGQTCKELLAVAHLSLHKRTLPYSGILGAMLVGTRRKGFQKPKHLMQLCSNDSFSSPFSPSLFRTSSFIPWLLPFPAQGGTKIPREGLLSPAALLPVKRPGCISYSLFGHLLFCTVRYPGSTSQHYMGEENQPCSARAVGE